MTQICKSFDDLKKRHLKNNNFCDEGVWGEPKDIYILDDKYIDDMRLSPEVIKYIDAIIEKKLEKIKKELILTTEESLYDLWDNEYDDRWNKC